ncbi:hypothetical protein FACS189494_09200 [Spirochaetia bacterium]|nr:hypothetical protein FACS189494_09200 [Spirochaetia bacterium]
MTTLQQTIEIPVDHRLFIEVPKEIPAGTATFRLEWTATPSTSGVHEDCTQNIRELRELCKGSSVTVDSFLEKRHRERDRENAKYRHIFQREGE